MLARPIAISLFAFTLVGCSCNNPQTLRERTADVTAATRNATGEIAAGVFQGLVRPGARDLNTATSRELQKLPGITSTLARAIIAGRPYTRTDDLVSRQILTRPQFTRIKAQVKVTPRSSSPAR